MLALDDATGTIAAARFREQEDTRGYLLLVQDIIHRHGILLAIYTDRHSVFLQQGTPWEKAHQVPPGKRTPTQFARALRELGITHIFALSPEAMGRVERANGTLQDRRVAELRLADARTTAEANAVLAAFVPRFNARFGVPAAQAGSAYRPPSPDLDLASILCIKHTRKVAKDNTVLYQQNTVQLFPTATHPTYAGASVEIQERLDGQLVVAHQGRIMTSRTAPPHARMLRGHGVTGLHHGPRVPSDGAPVLDGEALLQQVDTARLAWHSERIKAGMERARQRGRRIGRPPVPDTSCARPDFIIAAERVRSGQLPAGRAAKELGMGYHTLKRLLAKTGTEGSLTESLDTSP